MSEPFFNGPLARLVRSFLIRPGPDPWPPDVDASVRDSTAVPLCFDCLHPREYDRPFCIHCGSPNGNFVSMDPYLQLFIVGDTLRKGVMGPPERRAGVQLFLVVFSLCQYAVLAPIYWFWMLRRAQAKPICSEGRKPIEFEEAD